MTGAPHYPQGSGDGYAFSLLNRVERLETHNAELRDSLESLVRLWEAQAIHGTTPNAPTWALIRREVERANAALAKSKGGRS